MFVEETAFQRRHLNRHTLRRQSIWRNRPQIKRTATADCPTINTMTHHGDLDLLELPFAWACIPPRCWISAFASIPMALAQSPCRPEQSCHQPLSRSPVDRTASCSR